MKSLFTACLLGASVALELEGTSSTSAPSYTSISIKENGVAKTLYVAMYASQSSGSTINMPYNNGGTLLTSTPLTPDAFYRPNLLGGSVEFDVNLSATVCGCVEAFYLVSAPGKDSSGNYWDANGWGYYYCDANAANNSNLCPEFDIMEANIYAMQTTPHSCNPPTSLGFYSTCDGIGKCYQNSVTNRLSYGPGSKYKINTTKPFHLKMEFQASGTTFTQWVNTMT
jgi:hypothetical protein